MYEENGKILGKQIISKMIAKKSKAGVISIFFYQEIR